MQPVLKHCIAPIAVMSFHISPYSSNFQYSCCITVHFSFFVHVAQSVQISKSALILNFQNIISLALQVSPEIKLA